MMTYRSRVQHPHGPIGILQKPTNQFTIVVCIAFFGCTVSWDVSNAAALTHSNHSLHLLVEEKNSYYQLAGTTRGKYNVQFLPIECSLQFCISMYH